MADANRNSTRELTFEQLKQLDAQLDRQLQKTAGTDQSAAGSKRRFTFKKLILYVLGAVAALLFPFLMLIRSSLFLYSSYQLNGWLALAAGIFCTWILLLIYVLAVNYLFTERYSISKHIRKGMFILVSAYCLYGLVYFSGINAKSDELTSYYRSLHPILRVSLATTILADNDLIVTDMQREPEDYKSMGLPVKQQSMHYVQKSGYVHAVDIRTKGRPEWKNWMTRGMFYLLGLPTIRHVGTADHLHISMPVNR